MPLALGLHKNPGDSATLMPRPTSASVSAQGRVGEIAGSTGEPVVASSGGQLIGCCRSFANAVAMTQTAGQDEEQASARRRQTVARTRERATLPGPRDCAVADKPDHQPLASRAWSSAAS